MKASLKVRALTAALVFVFHAPGAAARQVIDALRKLELRISGTGHRYYTAIMDRLLDGYAKQEAAINTRIFESAIEQADAERAATASTSCMAARKTARCATARCWVCWKTAAFASSPASVSTPTSTPVSPSDIRTVYKLRDAAHAEQVAEASSGE